MEVYITTIKHHYLAAAHGLPPFVAIPRWSGSDFRFGSFDEFRRYRFPVRNGQRRQRSHELKAAVDRMGDNDYLPFRSGTDGGRSTHCAAFSCRQLLFGSVLIGSDPFHGPRSLRTFHIGLAPDSGIPRTANTSLAWETSC